MFEQTKNFETSGIDRTTSKNKFETSKMMENSKYA